jgi:hypothetical protein
MKAGQQELATLFEKEGPKVIATGIDELSVFQFGRVICTYTESEQDIDVFDWNGSLADVLESWPSLNGLRYSVRMTDIFHDGVPTDPQSWRGSRQIDSRIGSIARVKPEMAASYIYYHYQLQEEYPGEFNKTYIIGYHDHFLFSYVELPAALSERKRTGKLDSKVSPKSDWQQVMNPHFVMWENSEPWTNMIHLCAISNHTTGSRIHDTRL